MRGSVVSTKRLREKLERSIRANVCGATDNGGRFVCTRAPHSVELLPEGDPNHSRWHVDTRGGVMRAEWSSPTDSDEGRMWPDGHFGLRSEAPS